MASRRPASPRPLHIVDVFTHTAHAGNPLAVVTHAAGLSTRKMQAFAREMNFSETTFVLDDAPVRGAWRTRIFTPAHEIPFAGHPTLGTAHVIRTQLARGVPETVTLALKIGRVPVVTAQAGRRTLYWMTQPAPRWGGVVAPGAVARALGLRPADLDTRFPVQEVSTGLATLIVPVRTRAALAGIRVDRPRLLKLVEGLEAKSVLAFCVGAADRRHQLTVRVFVDYYGVPEDPATGSSNGCLAAWLARHRVLGTEAIDVRALQGVAVGRPSTLHLRTVPLPDGGLEVQVGGGVVDIVTAGRLA
jgi:trans-2,3-dihydro-3-hydroxyanthranilate isomerase